MTEEFLFSKGYKKVNHNTYEKLDEETGMMVELEFNPNGNIEQNKEIENDIINILTRHDI